MSRSAGYGHPDYARSLEFMGHPIPLAQCDGWVIARPISGTPRSDVTGCYPLFVPRRWDRIKEDLDALSDRFVSATVVCDPFGVPSEAVLHRAFDVVRPFKSHVIANLSRREFSRHHVGCIKRASRHVVVEVVDAPETLLPEWNRLYDGLVERHGIRGPAAFSTDAFAIQFTVPGVRVFRAVVGDETVGAHVWYVAGEAAYHHLQALSEKGYALGASYALYDAALQHLADQASLADLGGCQGSQDDHTSGLFRFKRGWASGLRTVYLAGRVLNRSAYAQLASAAAPPGNYFPAYRAPAPRSEPRRCP